MPQEVEGPLSDGPSFSFIAQKTALGLTRGLETQAGQKYVGMTVPQPSARSSKRAHRSQRGRRQSAQRAKTLGLPQQAQTVITLTPAVPGPVGVGADVPETGGAENLGVHVAATVTPQVEVTAPDAQGYFAPVAVDHGGDGPADAARDTFALDDPHGRDAIR